MNLTLAVLPGALATGYNLGRVPSATENEPCPISAESVELIAPGPGALEKPDRKILGPAYELRHYLPKQAKVIAVLFFLIECVGLYTLVTPEVR